MPPPTDEQVEELIGISRMVRMLVMATASSPSIVLSVHYTLFIEAMIAAAMAGSFDNVMMQVRRDRDRFDAMLKATNAQELYEIAKFTADVVVGNPESSSVAPS